MSVEKTMNHKQYPKSMKRKTVAELMYIIKDASQARDAFPDGINAGYYADEVCYAGMELQRRKA